MIPNKAKGKIKKSQKPSRNQFEPKSNKNDSLSSNEMLVPFGKLKVTDELIFKCFNYFYFYFLIFLKKIKNISKNKIKIRNN